MNANEARRLLLTRLAERHEWPHSDVMRAAIVECCRQCIERLRELA